MVDIKNGMRNGSLRVHTRASQLPTSSNQSFQKHLRNGLGTGVNLTNSAVRRVLGPVPGSAALSASLSDAASTLGSSSSLGGVHASPGVGTVDGDSGSLQDELLRNNNEMLETQMRVLHATTSINTRSNIVKAMYDTLKTIGSNIR